MDYPNLAVLGALLALFACRPANQNMLVADVQGDIFLPALHTGNWGVGEVKQCQIASQGSIKPDKGRDLLLCGDSTKLAWSQTWLRPDIKKQIYDAASSAEVRFHSAGHGGGRTESPSWRCTRMIAGIDCE